MICLEIIVNGERRTLAGAAAAQTISAEVCTYPELQQAWLQVHGEVMPEGQPEADADWLSTQLSVGDQVQIRLIETDEPVSPQLTRVEPTAPASDEIPFVCGFCNKDATQTEGMVASRKAMICHACIRYLSDIVKEDDDV